ncbi:hypothetical protein L2E82_40645 [Cichorium intybus]|uniref:Uncharacterized protein n=1 Tax=Cichorium intybus TaxID=13427 RepID=A0ACB9AM80_CICIN|nr:hypothetical protein L2E82_40645 [Cichorium intybus]
MARIHPCIPTSSSPSSFCSNERETYTIWMKSLVLNSNGYTVYDSNGDVVFRIDNYDSKCSNEVYLMDLRGNVVCTILRKKLLRFGLWACYNDKDSRKPWFEVGKTCAFFKNDSVYDVLVGSNETGSVSGSKHKMEGSLHGLEFKVTDMGGRADAKVERKRSSSGVVLGEDVLLVTVEPHVDHIFVLALVAIHALIRHKM